VNTGTRLTVLGGCGAWPQAGDACSGFLLECEGYRLVIDLGYATVPRLLQHIGPDEVDAVYVSHGHPDHCADLNPLLRARMLRDDPADPLPLYAPRGALDKVLALDRPGMLDAGYRLHEFTPGDRLDIGPFTAETRLLPHYVPNAGVRLAAAGRVVTYTGDCGPHPDVPRLADGADLFIAEASHATQVPADNLGHLSSARDAGAQATQAGARHLLLTHLMYDTAPDEALAAAAKSYQGPITLATPGLVVDL
jgi:ribonuclease BN (tRNA processing enzyme)